MSEKTRISIAMAVYNGERFISEQLESFVQQKRLPDELIVADVNLDDAPIDFGCDADQIRKHFGVVCLRILPDLTEDRPRDGEGTHDDYQSQDATQYFSIHSVSIAKPNQPDGAREQRHQTGINHHARPQFRIQPHPHQQEPDGQRQSSSRD